MIPMTDDPICRVEWRHWSEFAANAWNPNVVFDDELRLLELSILRTGWVQPVLANPSGIIIDGFHRWSLSRISQELGAKYEGRLPVAVLPIDDAEAKIVTVRMNRAKGKHVAVRMHELIVSLIDEHGLFPEEIAVGIGATRDEVDLLYQDGVFKARNLQSMEYSRAWVPGDPALDASAAS